MSKDLSLEGLVFQATKIDIDENVLTITLNRPEKKNAFFFSGLFKVIVRTFSSISILVAWKTKPSRDKSLLIFLLIG